MEVERKWIVPAVPPEVRDAPSEAIEQGYLVIEPGGGEARVRRKGDRCYLTVKGAGTLARGEYEIEITEDQFAALWPATEGRRVVKRRHRLGGIEVDVFGGELEGLIVAEVEFPAVQDARAYTAPDWFGADVTEDSAYKNRALAVNGRP